MAVGSRRRRHIHRRAERVGELLRQASECEKRLAGRRVDQQIDVARLGVLATGDGAEDAQIARAVPLGYFNDPSGVCPEALPLRA